LPQVRVVLVRPETPANVGACARLVRNTGGSGLDLVQPGDWRTVECWRSAWGAQEVLEQARVFDTLEAALAGAALSVAFTRRRPSGPALEDVRTVASELAALGRLETAALVFGPETHGLSNQEIGVCGRAATIASDHGQPSYNLSHAVAIAVYEVHRARRRHHEQPPRRATHEEKERLLALLREGLEAIAALPRVNAEGAFAEWRTLVQGCALRERELKLLEHVARRMALAARRG
jgi:tRNA/rRNA methyltransferase